jgi:hypothetical protein
VAFHVLDARADLIGRERSNGFAKEAFVVGERREWDHVRSEVQGVRWEIVGGAQE